MWLRLKRVTADSEKMKDISVNNVLRIAVLFLVLGWCFYIIRPFIIIIIWAVIIGVALFPLFRKFVGSSGNKKIKTALFTLVATIVILIPSYFIVDSIVVATSKIVNQIRSDSFDIPEPDQKVKTWPLIGEQLYDEWIDINEDFEKYVVEHKDLVLEYGAKVFSGITGFVGTLIVFLISFLIGVIFMYHSDTAYQAAIKLFRKLLGGESEEIVHMSRDTIRSVVKGILLVALIQALLAFIGFKAIGLPAAGIFTLLVLVAAVIQFPVLLVMIPAILIVFSSTESTTYAVIFTIYAIIVSLSDNIFKPLLLGKGLKTPMIVILIGTIGGLLLHGIIGLFVGPVVLAVVYQLYVYWVNTPAKGGITET